MHRNYPKRLSESESGKITQHIDAGVDGIGQILGKFHQNQYHWFNKKSVNLIIDYETV